MPSKKAAQPTTATYDKQGQLLGETDYGVDYIESSVYASAIAESIHNAKTSITVGIYARWGSGKSFLLKHVESMGEASGSNPSSDRMLCVGSLSWRLIADITAVAVFPEPSVKMNRAKLKLWAHEKWEGPMMKDGPKLLS